MDTALNSGTVLEDLGAAGVSVSHAFADGELTFIDVDGEGNDIVISARHSARAYGGVAAGTATNTASTISVTTTGEGLLVEGTDASGAGLTAATGIAPGSTL